MVSFCLHNNSLTLNALIEQSKCAISILADDQANLAKHFAYVKGDKFKDVNIDLSPILNLPTIPSCLGWLECKINQTIIAGDHTIFICEVVNLGLNKSLNPLIYYDRKFIKL